MFLVGIEVGFVVVILVVEFLGIGRMLGVVVVCVGLIDCI